MRKRAWAVHISDIHLGPGLEGAGIVNKVLPGLGAHDMRALIALGNFLRDFPRDPDRDGEESGLVFSGDATVAGSMSELSYYRTLVDRGVCIDDLSSIGPFRAGFSAALEMPGNHDYWAGVPLNPKTNGLLRESHFTGQRSIVLNVGKRVVALHTLCSTCGATEPEQFMAVGAFAPDELNAFETSIKKVNSDHRGRSVTHFIVTHHSPSDGTPIFHGLRADSRRELEKRCSTHCIRGLLTGHTHRYRMGAQNPLPPEARCSSTLQDRSRRELLVHEFEEKPTDDVGLGWRVHVYKFNGATRFKHVSTVSI